MSDSSSYKRVRGEVIVPIPSNKKYAALAVVVYGAALERLKELAYPDEIS